MKYRTNSIFNVFLFFTIIIWIIAPGQALAQTASKGEAPQKTIDRQINNTQVPATKIKAVDKAGERIGKGIDKFSRSASLRIGK